jgi:tetratricopeptide (TPR) repeat protein
VASLSRQRLAVLAVAAVVGAGVVVALSLRSSDDTGQAAATTATVAAPLSGLPLVALPPVAGLTNGDRLTQLQALAAKDPERADLQMAIGSEQLIRGDGEAATAAFTTARRLGDPGADVALVVAGYDPEEPDATVARLRLLAPTQPFAAYELGVVQLWAGRVALATTALKAVRDAAPESFYGIKADDLLHPTMQAGYPLFVPAEDPPENASTATLAAAARAAPDDAVAQLQYGAALQAEGQRTEALAAYRQALKADPTSIEAQVALAVAGFQKDDPAKAFGTIGPLARDHAGDPSPRFHLGMMLLWIGQTEQAKAQFQQVEKEAPGSRLARLADFFTPK